VLEAKELPPELSYLTVTDQPLPNDPPRSVWSNLRRLHAVLSVFSRTVGPIHVSSGYRSAEVNEAVGGVPTSLHRKGRAADIQLATPEKTREFFLALASDPSVLPGTISELILYVYGDTPSHLHVGIPEQGLAPQPVIRTKRFTA